MASVRRRSHHHATETPPPFDQVGSIKAAADRQTCRSGRPRPLADDARPDSDASSPRQPTDSSFAPEPARTDGRRPPPQCENARSAAGRRDAPRRASSFRSGRGPALQRARGGCKRSRTRRPSLPQLQRSCVGWHPRPQCATATDSRRAVLIRLRGPGERQQARRGGRRCGGPPTRQARVV